MAVQRVRATPRISINKLAEYLVAPAGRRRTILREQKRPKTFQQVWYADADRVIRMWYARPNRDKQFLQDAIIRLAARSPARDYETQKAGSCTEAISAFATMVDTLELDGTQVFLGPPRPRAMRVAGVSVSVRPEVFIVKPGDAGAPTFGATKLYFSKTKPLSQRQGEYIAAFLRHYVERVRFHGAPVDYKRCNVIDVMSQTVHTAPRAIKRRLDDIEAACEEIAGHWPLL